MKISFITTVFNEEKTIEKFLRSLAAQTKQPDEIVIVDGGSSDRTFSIISNVKYPISNVKLKIFRKRGNRSVGRNEAIKNATGDIIVCSDSGNILDKKWLEKITDPFLDSRFRGNDKKRVDVVAGYYKGVAKNVFQKCLISYTLVMPDKVDPDTFLPATRSIAFTKKIWKKIGGFDEQYSHNEDYVFANKLKKAGARIVFAKDAIVNWIPRSTYREAFIMFFRFALGDAESKIVRGKVILLFLRYAVGCSLLVAAYFYKSFIPLFIVGAALLLYCLWAIQKNYHYVKNSTAMIILPLLQITADLAVLFGTIVGAYRIAVVKWILSFLLFSLLIFLPFRTIRQLFSIPEINEQKIVGHAHYFGYPLYFETILFFLFVLLPVMTFFIHYKSFKNEK